MRFGFEIDINKIEKLRYTVVIYSKNNVFLHICV